MSKDIPMWKRPREEYSPLRPFRETGRLYLEKYEKNKKKYPETKYPSSYREPTEQNEEQTKFYNEIKNRLYDATTREKQLLDMYVSRLSQEKLNLPSEGFPFKRLSFFRDEQEKDRGTYDRNNKDIGINLLGSELNEIGLANVLNHEFTHASNDLDTNLEEWMEDKLNGIRSNATLANQYKDYKGITDKSYALTPEVKKSYDNDLSKYKDFVQKLQDTIDPFGRFSRDYPGHRIKYPKIGNEGNDNLQTRGWKGPPSETRAWRADEFNGHFMQNLPSSTFDASDDPEVNEFLLNLAEKHKEKLDKDYHLNNYPELNSRLQQQILLLKNKNQLNAQQQNPFGHPSAQPSSQLNNPLFSGFGSSGPQVPNIPLAQQFGSGILGQQFSYPYQPVQQPQLYPSSQQRDEDQEGSSDDHKDDLEARLNALKKDYASGGSVSSDYDPYLNTGSISSGLGSLYDYINHRYARGGGVGLGNMGRFFGLYPKINY